MPHRRTFAAPILGFAHSMLTALRHPACDDQSAETDRCPSNAGSRGMGSPALVMRPRLLRRMAMPRQKPAWHDATLAPATGGRQERTEDGHPPVEGQDGHAPPKACVARCHARASDRRSPRKNGQDGHVFREVSIPAGVCRRAWRRRLSSRSRSTARHPGCE